MRLAEFGEVAKKLEDLFKQNCYQIWTGDFNALTKTDYDETTWEEIARIRAKNRWESPQTTLTTEVWLSVL